MRVQQGLVSLREGEAGQTARIFNSVLLDLVHKNAARRSSGYQRCRGRVVRVRPVQYRLVLESIITKEGVERQYKFNYIT